MTTIVAEFDGKVFVPEQPVDLLPGTKVAIALPGADQQLAANRRRPTAEQRRELEQFIAELNQSPPYFPTAEDALAYSRMYPGKHG